MPMRGTLPLPKDQIFSSASYRDLLAVCAFAAASFTVFVGFALEFRELRNLIAAIALLGG
jgi:hypothetical protein